MTTVKPSMLTHGYLLNYCFYLLYKKCQGFQLGYLIYGTEKVSCSCIWQCVLLKSGSKQQCTIQNLHIHMVTKVHKNSLWLLKKEKAFEVYCNDDRGLQLPTPSQSIHQNNLHGSYRHIIRPYAFLVFFLLWLLS